jgi:hypothetical protein
MTTNTSLTPTDEGWVPAAARGAPLDALWVERTEATEGTTDREARLVDAVRAVAGANLTLAAVVSALAPTSRAQGDARPRPDHAVPSAPVDAPGAHRASEPGSRWLTPPAAARATGVPLKTIRGWIHNGRIESRVRNRDASPRQAKFLVNVDEVGAAARVAHAVPDRGGATAEIAEQVDRMIKGRR